MLKHRFGGGDKGVPNLLNTKLPLVSHFVQENNGDNCCRHHALHLCNISCWSDALHKVMNANFSKLGFFLDFSAEKVQYSCY